jgi:hypothetical protein
MQENLSKDFLLRQASSASSRLREPEGITLPKTSLVLEKC